MPVYGLKTGRRLNWRHEIDRANCAKERNNNDLLSLSADPVSFRWFKIFGLFNVHALKISIRISFITKKYKYIASEGGAGNIFLQCGSWQATFNKLC
jgi:hypothetical protein